MLFEVPLFWTYIVKFPYVELEMSFSVNIFKWQIEINIDIEILN